MPAGVPAAPRRGFRPRTRRVRSFPPLCVIRGAMDTPSYHMGTLRMEGRSLATRPRSREDGGDDAVARGAFSGVDRCRRAGLPRLHRPGRRPRGRAARLEWSGRTRGRRRGTCAAWCRQRAGDGPRQRGPHRAPGDPDVAGHPRSVPGGSRDRAGGAARRRPAPAGSHVGTGGVAAGSTVAGRPRSAGPRAGRGGVPPVGAVHALPHADGSRPAVRRRPADPGRLAAGRDAVRPRRRRRADR